jgi:hypothetical protein
LLLQIRVFGKTQSGNPIRGSSISKNCKQRLFNFIKTWGYFPIAICCPLLERRFTGIFHGGRKFLQFKIHDTFFGLKRNLSSLHWRGTGLEAIRCFEVRRLKTQNGLEIGPSPIQEKLELEVI